MLKTQSNLIVIIDLLISLFSNMKKIFNQMLNFVPN